MAHIVLSDFQIMYDKKIHKLAKGTRLDKESYGYYQVTVKGVDLEIDKDVVINSPEFFKEMDLASEIAEVLKKHKTSVMPKTAKAVAEYIEENVLSNYIKADVLDTHTLVDMGTLTTMLYACLNHSVVSGDDDYLNPIKKLGWSVTSNNLLSPPVGKQQVPVKQKQQNYYTDN
jgi:hypothetical protein